MEKEKLNKKQIIPLIIGVLTMIILVSSATYAYFKVSVGNTATSTTITGDIGGDTIGTVTLSGGGSNLYLGVSAYDMSESKKGTTYYSSTTEGSRETNVNSAGKTTYTATLSGDESDSVMYACDYEFTVTSSGTALEESINDIEIVFEGDIKKTLPLSTSGSISGTWFGFKKSNAEREFNAYLQLKNTDSNQNSLSGTNLSVEIKNTKWKCYLSENDELVGDAYALLIPNSEEKIEYSRWIDESYADSETGKWITAGHYEQFETYSSMKLTFVRSESSYNVGDTFDDKEIISVYTGFETKTYENYNIPWNDYMKLINNVIFEDEIRPISTAWWFYYMGVDACSQAEECDTNINLTNLNTSLVTNMSGMFQSSTSGYPELEAASYTINVEGLNNLDVSNVTDMSFMFSYSYISEINVSNWNTSNVTDMSYMFAIEEHGYSLGITGIENWNVSNVTNMSGMFSSSDSGYMNDVSYNLSGWNVSNVTDMSNMFNLACLYQDIGIQSWDTGNVTSMEAMFNGAELNVDIDLSGWDVSNVEVTTWFQDDMSGTGTLTPPKFNLTVIN